MPKMEIDYPGSRWLKFDFHTHTPASVGDFGKGNNDLQSITPEQWLESAMKSGLDCVVVTDHNSGGWIDPLKNEYKKLSDSDEKPEWFSDLTIFPGVEITVNNGNSRAHLLGVFDPSTGSQKITAVLGACGISYGFGNPDTSTGKGFSDTVNKIIENGGIVIPAHIDGKKGFLEDRKSSSPEIEKNINELLAAEFCNLKTFDDTDLKKLVDKLAKLAGSDAHTPGEIGKHFTWVKMGHPSIEGLELALMDHEFCIKNQIENPNHFPDIFLSQLEISAMAHCGRVNPLTLSLHPHFNAVIGGRGTGKSSLLESIRIGARRDKELEPFERLNEELKQFLRDQSGPGKNRGVMLNNTELLIGIYRRGKHFRLRWRYDGTGHVLEEDKDGLWQAAEMGDLNERFPLSIYSQKQINELASNSRGLLEIIDRYINRSEWDRKWEDEKSRFLQLNENLRMLTRQLEEKPAIRAKLNDVKSDLKQYEEKGHGDILKLYQKRNQQKNCIPNDAVFDDITGKLKNLAEISTLPDFQDNLFDPDDDFKNELKTIYDQSAQGLDQIKERLQELAITVGELKKKKNESIENSLWFQSLQSSTQAYNNLVKEYEGKQNELSISLYGDWVRERDRLQKQLTHLDSIQNETRSVRCQIEESYEKLMDLRDELIETRRQFIQKVIGSNEYVRMELVQFGDVNGVENEYRNMLNIDGEVFKSSVCDIYLGKGILLNIHNWEVHKKTEAEIAGIIEAIKNETIAIAKGKACGNHGSFDNRLKSLMKKRPAAFDQLCVWWPEDLLRVKYSKEPSKGRFENLEKGSAGQKAAAILAFLLSHGKEPLIIDQPEDDLDNALIYDLIVKQIHENKNRRQLIIVTHNPNIVVNGDAELVHVLKFENGQVQVNKQGGITEADIRDLICTIMEGGRQAFEKRYKRITIGDRHV